MLTLGPSISNNISSGIKEPVFSSILSFQYFVNLLNMQGVRVTGDPSYELMFQLMTAST